MDGIESTVSSTPSPSGEQGASPAPAVASGGNEGLGEGLPAGQLPAADPAPTTDAQQNSDAAVTPDQQNPAQPQGGSPAVPQLRAHVQTLEGDLGNWKQLGQFDQVKSDVGLVNAMFSQNPTDFWAQLHTQSPNTVMGVLDAAIKAWPQFFVDTLQQQNLIPQATPATTPTQSRTVDPSELAGIDQKFHKMYASLPASERYSLQQDDDETRNWKLDQYQKSFDHDQMLAEQKRVNDDREAQQYQQQTYQIGQDFRNAVWGGVQQQLADKLKPTGNAEIDGALGEVVRTWAEFALRNDAAAQPVVGQLDQAIEKLEVRKAMSLAAPMQTHANRVIGSFLEKLAPIFDGYHKYMASQRSNGANRVEAPIPGVTAPQQNGQLPANAGEFDADNLRAMSRSIFG